MKKGKFVFLIMVVVLLGLTTSTFARSALRLFLNGQEVTSETEFQVVDGHVLVPLRTVAKWFGATIDWDEETNSVIIESKEADDTDNSSEILPDGSVVYSNSQYGFSFSLPESWKGYTVLTDKWEGLAFEGSQSGEVIESGPSLRIRHPQWTSEEPRQDIPIMVFTLAQWELQEQDKFHIGAAPMNPSAINSNDKYVFALPARYNYAFPTGYEEVEQILEGNPLKPF